MDHSGAIDEMSGGELLDFVGELAVEERRIDAKVLLAALQHAVLNGAGTVDPVAAKLPGREQAVRLGGDGTPRVAEFAPAEFAAWLGVSSYAGRELIADSLDLAHRLPRLWSGVQALAVPARFARLVARKTRDLSRGQADEVDERVAEYADGRLPWTRFEAQVDAAVVAADPETAKAREEAAAAEQFARATRSDDHGMRGFYVRAPFAVIGRLDVRVAYLADALAAMGDTDSLDVRRVKAMLILANPTEAVALLQAYAEGRHHATNEADLLPTVTVFVHLYGGVHTDGVARVEGMGPVSESWIKDHLSPHANVTIRPVLGLAGQAPVDAYEIPDRHRQAVHLMTPADTFPFSCNTSRSHQIDHTEPYRDGKVARGAGQSRLGNYGPMTTSHHRVKTFGDWEVKQPFAGIYVWRDPHGATYLVDHTGTRRIGLDTAQPRPRTQLETRFSEVALKWAA